MVKNKKRKVVDWGGGGGGFNRFYSRSC